LGKLEKRKIEGTMRSLDCFEGYVDFYSNDYLGLSKKAISNSSIQNSSTGSRLISGNCIEAQECEIYLADFFKVESSLIFNSGYDANLGFFSCIPQKGDTVLYDDSIHASVRDGIRLSFADSFSFKHNSCSDLKEKLVRSKGTVYIVVESLYSMNGDVAPLKEISTIAKENKAYLIVDEAHACGVFGENGRGLIDELAMEKEVFARIITFGKAFGAHGACVLGTLSLCDYLLNFARSFIYTTALPPNEYRRIFEMVSFIEIPELQKQLKDNILYFRNNCDLKSFVSHEYSPIQMLKIGDVQKTTEFSHLFLNNKLAIKPIFSPTVKIGEEGIRFCIHAFNTKEEIESVCELLNRCK
jgi:8-amino-7-oxononanoate synthase